MGLASRRMTTWPWAALVLAGLLLLALLALPRTRLSARLRDPAWLFWLMLPIYMLHQFEEHGVDLLGRRYFFQVFMCGSLGFTEAAGCPADEAFILAVNVGSVWIAGVLGGLFGARRPLIGAAALAIPLVNGFAHVVPAVIHHAYNPGLLTAIVLFWPFCAWTLWVLVSRGELQKKHLPLVVAAGVLLHALLLGPLLAYSRGLISRELLLTVQVANGFIPLLVGWWGPRPRLASSEAP